MKYKRIFILIQCSWGILQTFAGFCIFLCCLKCPHNLFYGCVRTRWKSPNGLSLGLFIFTPNENSEILIKRHGASHKEYKDFCERMTVHEFGHSCQSLLLGPLFLIPGLCSFVRCGFRSLKHRSVSPYYDYWTERWANRLGEKTTGRKAPV